MNIRNLIHKHSEQLKNINALDINGLIEKEISDVIYELSHLIVAYKNIEMSLNGQIKTASDLKSSLSSLVLKINAIAESKIFSQLVMDVDDIIFSAKNKKDEIYLKYSNTLQPEIQEVLGKKIDLSLNERIKQCSYRTLKRISSSESALTAELIKNFPFPGYFHLQKDLELFLRNHQNIFTDNQKRSIAELTPLLNKSYEIDKQISFVYRIEREIEFEKSEPVKIKLRELATSMKADIVYDIESSIEQLKPGQRFLFPGGLDANRYVLFEVQRQLNGKYQFGILNTGKEANYYQDSYRGFLLGLGITNYARTPVFGELPLEAVADTKFIEALVGFQSSTGIPNLEKSVYEAISNQFTQIYKGQLTQRELHLVQEWGSTSFDPVLAYVEYALPPSLFIPFHFDMLLRARIDLAQHLPQAIDENIFSEKTLKFIDEKSCKSIDASKKDFKTYCRDLNLDIRNINDVYGSASSSKTIETVVSKNLERYLDLYDKFGTRKSMCRNVFRFDPNDKSIGIDPMVSAMGAYDSYQSYQYSNPGVGPNIPPVVAYTVSYYGNLFFSYVGDKAIDFTCRPYVNEFKEIQTLENRLISMQKTIDQHSPVVANQIRSRKQTLLSCAIKDLKNINFDQILSDFKDLYASSGFCNALLQSQSSPLHSAVKSCAKLLKI